MWQSVDLCLRSIHIQESVAVIKAGDSRTVCLVWQSESCVIYSSECCDCYCDSLLVYCLALQLDGTTPPWVTLVTSVGGGKVGDVTSCVQVMSQKVYLPVTSRQKVTCDGSLDLWQKGRLESEKCSHMTERLACNRKVDLPCDIEVDLHMTKRWTRDGKVNLWQKGRQLENYDTVLYVQTWLMTQLLTDRILMTHLGNFLSGF